MVIRFVFVIVSQSLCTFISAGSKLAQLQCLWRSKDSRQVSTLTWALATYTCLGKWHERKTKHFSSLLYWHWVLSLFVSTDLYHRHHHRRHTRSVRASWRDVNWTEVLIVIFIFLFFFSSHTVCRHEHSEPVGHSHSHLLQTSCSETGLRGFFLHRVYLNVFSGVLFFEELN